MADSKGTVKFFSGQKGFGFIAPDGGGKDVFFHVSNVSSGMELKDGVRVEFEIAQGPKGPKAINVREHVPGEKETVFVCHQVWQGAKQLMMGTEWSSNDWTSVTNPWRAPVKVTDPTVTPGVWEVEVWGKWEQISFIKKIKDEDEMLAEAEAEARAKEGGWFEGEVFLVLEGILLEHPYGAQVYWEHDKLRRIVWEVQKACLASKQEIADWLTAKLDSLQREHLQVAHEGDYLTRWAYFGLEVEVNGVWRQATYDSTTKVVTVKPLVHRSRETMPATAHYGDETWQTGGPDVSVQVERVVAKGFSFTKELTPFRQWGGKVVKPALFVVKSGRGSVWGLVDSDTDEVVAVWDEKRRRWAGPAKNFHELWKKSDNERNTFSLPTENPLKHVYWVHFHMAMMQGLVIEK